MKKSTLVILALVAVVGGGITWKVLRPTPPTKVVLARAEVVPTLRSVVSATGMIRAKEFVDIQAEVAGVITELPVHEGDTVAVGDVLLKLEDLQLRAEVDSAKAQVSASEAEARNADVGVATAEASLATERSALANAKVEAAQAETSLARAQASFQRKEQLHQQNLIGSEEFEIAEAEARLAEQRLEFAKSRIAQAEANVHVAVTRVDAAKAGRDAALSRCEAQRAALKRAIDMAEKTVIRSPLRGRITALNVEKGERAVPGIQSNPVATLMTIADMSVIEAEIRVDEADIVAVQLGASATVEVDAMRDVELAGVVTEIGQSPIQEATSGGQNQEGKEFKVVVRLSDPPAELRPGFTATAEIVTATRTDCLVVPLQALTAREVEVDADGHYVPPPEPTAGEPAAVDGKGGESGVVVASERRTPKKELEGVFLFVDGRARFRPVKTGVTGDMDIEVLDGLRDGDQVVSGPYQALRKLAEWDRIAVDEQRQRNAIQVKKP